MADPAVPPTSAGRFRRDADTRRREERRRLLVSSMLADMRRFDSRSKRPGSPVHGARLDPGQRPAV
jgi:hypothetical protein